MLALAVITIIIIISIALYNKKQKEIETKREEDRKQKELKAKQAEEQKRRELKAKQAEEQKQRELKAKQAEEQKQQELIARQAEERKQRMLKARQEKERKQKELEARLEEERKQREFEAKQAEERRQKEANAKYARIIAEIERKRKQEKLSQIILSLSLQAIEREKEELSNKLKAIGADFIKVSNTVCKIITSENVNINNLFSLCEQLDLEYHINITDLQNNNLIEVIYDEYYCSILLEEDEEEKNYKKGNFTKQAERFLFCYLENRKIKRLENSLLSIIENGITQADKLPIIGNTIEELASSALENSNYDIDFQKNIDCVKDNDMLIVDYELPNMSNISDIKEYKYIASKKEISIKKYTDSYIAKRYEDVLYSITLRSLYEIFSIDITNEINGVTFNGFVTQVNPATGIIERKCILSIQVNRDKFLQINLSQVESKACFKALKGVSAAKLVDISPITPILTFNKKDRRFVEGKDVSVNQGTNLAAMHWEDFEHLVRELFEMEFARNGGEVRVTQASRDGGVDAIIFDPDPLRGGKIVVQAKRYTNTVGVSAVRDLYGTVINEGANTGILITTSDYGHDSYEFAKDKPLKLLNGGHLLALLHKNGRNAHINIEEAKKIMNENGNK